MSTPRLSPKTLNEWTLEQNILNELTRMFDSPFGIFYPIRLRHIFDIMPFDLSRIKGRKTKTYKLTPKEEGTGGGWDTKFSIPNGFESDSRVFYLQIKSGRHSEGNGITGSKFNIKNQDPNRHIEFHFNDNGKKGRPATQHKDLTILQAELIKQGVSEKAVLYAFPRITTMEQFDKIDRLLYHTTFLSLKEMEEQATQNKVSLLDGNLHHFRTCYKDEQKREISSEPFQLKSKDESPNLISEIMMVKIADIWNRFNQNMRNERLKDYLSLSLALELQLDPNMRDASSRFNELFEYYELDGYYRNLYQERKKMESDLFNVDGGLEDRNRMEIYAQVQKFITGLEGIIDINKAIPKNYTTPISEISIDMVSENNFRVEEDFSVMAVVF